MAKSFSFTQARGMIKNTNDILDKLRIAQLFQSGYVADIKKACDAISESEVLKILKGVPVDELNKHRQGIRTKRLKDSGYHSMADVYYLSVKELDSIDGVGEESAAVINRLCKKFSLEVSKSIKIRLSYDSQTAEHTALVSALSKYRKSLPAVNSFNRLLSEYEDKMVQAVKNLAPASNPVKWFFTSENKKNLAGEAYRYLSEITGSLSFSDISRQYKELKQTDSISSALAWDDFSKNNIALINILEEFAPGLLGSDDTIYALPRELAEKIRNEKISFEGLHCTLRRYQELGVKYILHQKRVLLGDEMGLGKTVQAIAAMVSLKNFGATHFVVVCPASVLANWCREIKHHSSLDVIKVHGNSRETALKQWVEKGGVAVTTYEGCEHFGLAYNFKFSLLVVDEAHYIKNPRAQRTANVKILCAHTDRLLFMTGTALENRVSEMISLIEILQPDIADEIKDMAFMPAAPRFRSAVAPVYYRRRRRDVLTELPELIENREWCTLSAEERLIYEHSILTKNFSKARQVSWNTDDISRSSKAVRMLEIIEDARDEGRKVIVFSFYLDTIAKICRMLGENCMPPITGSVPAEKRQDIIDRFDKAPAGTVLVAQIQSGGTGLNIQSDSVVIICEPRLKPSVENQAVSRAYRLGQSRNVLVHRLLCEDTIDERITDMLAEKQLIFDTFRDKSVAADKEVQLDEETLVSIINREIEKINRMRGIDGLII